MRGSGRLTLQSFLNQFPAVPRDLTEDEYRYATQTAMWAAVLFAAVGMAVGGGAAAAAARRRSKAEA